MNLNLENKKNINEKELEVLRFWNENKIFEKSLERPAGEDPSNKYSFYDGPPFATGLPHHGHLLAGTIKDTIPRYQTMKGNYVRRVWGWDCHGLPIENLIEKEFNLNSKKDIEEFGIDKFNKAAFESVLRYEKEWKEIVPRFGRWVDMSNPYKTMDATFTESVWWLFSELNKKDLVFEGHKSMHICPRCETTLAQSEVALGYKDLTDISVTAKFELVSEPNTFVLAWTTTPWTLPGNVALAVNENIMYEKIKVKDKDELYIVARSRKAEIFKGMEWETIEKISGRDLIDRKYKPVFDYYVDSKLENKENLYKIVSADFVTLDTGTGVVHIAPAFGEDDLNLGKEKSLPIIKHVAMNGEFVKEVTDFAGMKVKTKDDNQSADIAIIKYLAAKDLLFSKEKLVHSYPTCWRCETPLLNYATSSWFINVPKIKERNIEENQKINWVPDNIRDGRFGKWLEGARDWAVSRSRYWGAPMPIWKEVDGDEIKIIGSLKELAENNFAKPKNKYYLMRHGEALHNIEGRESTDMNDIDPLTEKGREEVLEASKNFNEEVDIIISSPFERALESANIMAQKLNKEVIREEAFREIDLGVYDKSPSTQLFADMGVDYLKYKTKLGGGESHGEVMDRCMKALMNLEEKYSGKKILIVTHGAPMRMMRAAGELYTEEEVIADELAHDTHLYPKNAEIIELDLKLVPRDETGAVNLHRPYIDDVILKSSSGKEMKRIVDVFDCWFESGSMPYAQFHYPFENKNLCEENFPAEFIAEGLDQTRGWFYSLLNIGVGVFNKAPYKNVIVNGIILAADGEKMSKSKNNYTSPLVIAEKYGADAFRYSLLSSPVMCAENIPFPDSLVEEVYKKVVAKLENVLSFYEMIVTDTPKNIEAKDPLNLWILIRLNEVLENTTKSMDNYKLDQATRPFEKFIDDLSTWYLRRSREKLKDNDEETLYTLYFVLNKFSTIIAPFMPFLSERIYQSVNKNNENKKESVHLEKWPSEFMKTDENILKEMEEVRNIVTEALQIRQKNNIPVRQPLGSMTINEDKSYLSKYADILKDELNIKNLNYKMKVETGAFIVSTINVQVDINITPDLKKEGDFRELARKIKDLRKENNLVASDVVSISIFTNNDRKNFIESIKEDLIKECKLKDIKLEDLNEGEKESYKIN